jgi:hypothetical protein
MMAMLPHIALPLMIADGYRLFLSPLPLWQDSRWPWLLLPLCVGVSVVYKSMKCATMKQVPREAAVITLWIILGMASAAVVLGVWVRMLER